MKLCIFRDLKAGFKSSLGETLADGLRTEYMEWAGDCKLYSASRPRLISSFPHEHFWPAPALGPWLGSKTWVSLSGITSHGWEPVTWPPPPAATWDERKRKLVQPTWAGSFSQNSLSHLLQKGLLHQSEEINVNLNRNKMRSVHRNYHCKTFTRVLSENEREYKMYTYISEQQSEQT